MYVNNVETRPMYAHAVLLIQAFEQLRTELRHCVERVKGIVNLRMYCIYIIANGVELLRPALRSNVELAECLLHFAKYYIEFCELGTNDTLPISMHYIQQAVSYALSRGLLHMQHIRSPTEQVLHAIQRLAILEELRSEPVGMRYAANEAQRGIMIRSARQQLSLLGSNDVLLLESILVGAPIDMSHYDERTATSYAINILLKLITRISDLTIHDFGDKWNWIVSCALESQLHETTGSI